MVDDALSGIRLKLSRAADEIKALDKEVVAFVTEPPAPYSASGDFNRTTRILTVRVRSEKTPDPMWSIRIGEVAHNLRSALDHLVWQLVILTTGRPPALPTKNQFPIFDSKEGFNSRGVDQFLRCVRQDAVDLIRSEQPYFTGEKRDSPLWHLQELSNVDKHRTIHVVGALIQGYRFNMPPTLEPCTIVDLEKISGGPIKQDTVLYRGQVIGGKLAYPWQPGKVEGHMAANIAFDESTPSVGGAILVQTLVGIQARVQRVIRRIGADILKAEL